MGCWLACLAGLVAATPEVVVQSPHRDYVREVAFTPDGGTLASASVDGTVKLWDLRVGRLVRSLYGATGPLHAVAVGPDGKLVAGAGFDRSVHVWDRETGREVAVLKGHTSYIQSIAFSPDGASLASLGRHDQQVAVWELATGVPRLVFEHPGDTGMLGFSPDGRLLAVATNQATRLYDAEAGDVLATFRYGPEDQVRAGEKALRPWDGTRGGWAVAFGRDGRRMALEDLAGVVHIVDVGRRAEVEGRSFPGRLRAFAPDGTLAVEDADGRRLRRDVETGRVVETLPALEGKTRFAALSPDGRSWAGAQEPSTVIVWDGLTGRAVRRFAATDPHLTNPGNAVRLLSVAWSPTAPILASGGLDRLVRLWDFRRGWRPRVIRGHVGTVSAIAFSPDGKTLATGDNSAPDVRLWRVEDGQLLRTLDGEEPRGPVTSLAFAPDGRALAVGHQQQSFALHDVEAGRLRYAVVQGEPLIEAPKTDAVPILRHASRGRPITGLAFTPDGRVLIVGNAEDLTITRYDVESGRRLSQGLGHPASVNALAYDPGSNRVAVAGGIHKVGAMLMEDGRRDNSIPLISLQDGGTLVRLFEGHGLQCHCVAFRPGGATLASGGGDGYVKLWSTATGEALASLFAETTDVGSVAFSPDGRYLASAGYDLTIRLWDVDARRLAATIVADRDDVVVVTPSGDYAATRGGLRGVAFRLAGRVVPFEQFDLRLNRPDRVMEQIGYAEGDLVRLYRHAHDRRLGRMKVREEALRDDFQLPEIRIVSPPAPLATPARTLDFRVRAIDKRANLDRLLVDVNDVPVYGRVGLDLRPSPSKTAERDIRLELSDGPNKIQVSALNAEGTESLKETFTVTYDGPAARPDLYVLAVGVSKYRNPAYNLRFAAKDAVDVGQFFDKAGRAGSGVVRHREILDEDATREAILDARAFLGTTRPDDRVIVYFAGHGTLDAKSNYYFGTTDVDLDDCGARGLSYEDIEGLLDGIAARRKLLLIDTCRAGEAEPGPSPVPSPVATGPLPAGVRGLRFESTAGSRARTLEEESLNGLFADLRRGSGAAVLVSSGPRSPAYEPRLLRHGAFTYAILEGLTGHAADADHDGHVRVSELRDFATRRVRELTGGRQTPVVRHENLEVDFALD